MIAEALPQSEAAFQRANTPFELGKVPRARKVLIIAALFGAVEPAANPCEKEGKHNNLLEVAYPWRSRRDGALRMCLAAVH